MIKIMIYSIYNYFNPRFDPTLVPKIAKEAGFNGIFFWWGKYKYFENINKFNIVDQARKVDLNIDNIHAPFEYANDLWGDDEDAANNAVNVYLSCITDCKLLGINKLVIHPTRTSKWPINISSKSIDRWKKIIDFAEKNNIILAFENLKAINYLRMIFEIFETKQIGFCYDCGHEHCFTPEIDLISCFSNKLCTVHLHDNNSYSDEHRPIGEGTVDWSEKIALLKRYGYDGSINLEIHYSEEKDFKFVTVLDYLIYVITSAKNTFNSFL